MSATIAKATPMPTLAPVAMPFGDDGCAEPMGVDVEDVVVSTRTEVVEAVDETLADGVAEGTPGS